MRKLVLAMAVLALGATVAFAGPNAGVTVTVHGNVTGAETNGDPCGNIPSPDLCVDTVPTAAPDASGEEWFIVLAAGANPLAFTTIVFGIGDYDPYACYLDQYGPCFGDLGPLEVPSDGWPGPNSGTAVSWAPNCLTGMMVPVYYFGAYVYGPGIVPLGNFYPGQNAVVVSCDDPPVEDPIDRFGSFGCGGEIGVQECPDVGPDTGACCVDTNQDGNPETCVPDQTMDECIGLGGVYQGDGTECGPNNEPCPPDEEPTATQETTWGQIKSIYR
jgi:hypothetical protein